jgi:hypothetical protein
MHVMWRYLHSRRKARVRHGTGNRPSPTPNRMVRIRTDIRRDSSRRGRRDSSRRGRKVPAPNPRSTSNSNYYEGSYKPLDFLTGLEQTKQRVQ